MNNHEAPYDLIIVGYGPTGLTLASLLGQQGHRIAVVERWPRLYGLPRLTHIDGETARLISLAADGEHALREAWTTPHYNWVNGKGQLLMDVAHGNTRKMIWDDHMSVHQPHIEEAIHDRIAGLPNVTLFRGYIASALKQGDDGVQLTIQPWKKGQDSAAQSGSRVVLRGSYLVGCDGSKSFLRAALGVDRLDFGFNERWLCVDTEPKRPLPSKFDENAVQVCDPRRGYMFMPIGRKRQRFEFALLPNEKTEDIASEEAAWRLLEQYHGLGRDDLQLIRHLVYTFECRLAKRWRVGHVFLAGDAAHTNPPYLGQGACSGMRDAANLAWKLDLVLRGVSGEALLDTYEAERRPHVLTLMQQARSLGLVANTANPIKAAVRDLLFRFKLTPKPEFPTLNDGMLQRQHDGKLAPGAGSLPGQGHLVVDGRKLRFDEHVGFAFALLLRHVPPGGFVPTLQAALDAAGVRCMAIDGPALDFARVGDADGSYRALMDELDADAVLLRPDFVLYGHARFDGLSELLRGLLSQLRCLSMPAPAGMSTPMG